jgi:hypothetical protein
LSVFSSCSNITAEGNGDLITTEQSVSFFDEIKASSSDTVQVHKELVTRVIDSNIIEYVQVEVQNKSLHIGIKKGVSSSFTKFIVDVYCPNIRGVETFSARISGDGNVSIWVIEHLKVSSFSSGNVTYLGTPKIDFKRSGSVKVKGE